MPQDQGVCVLTQWSEGVEYHTDDPVVAQVDWTFIEDEFRTDMELHGRSHETVGVFTQSSGQEGSDVDTEVLDNRGAAGKFVLGVEDARYVTECLERGNLLGVWHTHPHGHRLPSPADWAGHPRGVPMYIISVESDSEFMVLRYDDTNRPGVQADPDD